MPVGPPTGMGAHLVNRPNGGLPPTVLEHDLSATISDVWDFKKDSDGCWNWQRQSLRHELIEASRAPFVTFEACLADAQRCGYSGSLSISDPPARDAAGRLLRLTRR